MPKLYLIPNSISEDGAHQLPAYIAGIIKGLRVFFVEEPKSARRLLKGLDKEFPLQECQFIELSEHTDPQALSSCLSLLKKQDAGIISESGCPCVADPGADLVLMAQKANIEIIPLIGPSSILLALMASGLNGQNFAFNGYLPKDREGRLSKIKLLEKRSRQDGQTQIVMDTPYRNQNLLDDLLATCNNQTNLCIALDIGGAEQLIKTKTIGEWKQHPPALPKKPALFLI